MRKDLDRIIADSEIVLKGKTEQVKLTLCNILAGGHTLIEDAPGVGKTTLVKYFGKVMGLTLSRIQFTNDLLPSDIIGSAIFDKNSNSFNFHKGPLFGELILADELNRAPPKTQSALLQAMEERSISVEGNHFKLPATFSVIATQNPHLQIGTFDLPESQLDRFSMKIKMGYASETETIALLKNNDLGENLSQIKTVLAVGSLSELQKKVKLIQVDDSIYHTIYTLLNLSRQQGDMIPLSNRCGIDLVNVTKAWAYLSERDYVIPDDIHNMFPYVAGHRLVHPENSDIDFEHDMAKKILASL